MNIGTTIAFFGTGPLAESVVYALYKAGYLPSLIVTKKDSPQGRHMLLTPPYIKTWATSKGIEVYQPESLKDITQDSPLHDKNFDLFIVASYGKIIPAHILELPKKGVVNVHPSLLPKYRGPSPIESALLNGDSTTGVSIMLLDDQVDHGPILAQNSFSIKEEDTAGSLEIICGQMGGDMLAQLIPYIIEGTIAPKEQDHTQATLCTKISKEMGEISLLDDIREVRRKYRALTPWPGLYFFIEHKGKKIRVKVNGLDLVSLGPSFSVKEYIRTVTPEGKKEMDFESFKRGYML